MPFALKHAVWNKFHEGIISSFSSVLFSRLLKKRYALPVLVPSGGNRPSIRPNCCFLDPERHIHSASRRFLPSFFWEMLGPVPRFTYFSPLTFTYRAPAPTRAKSPQPRMLQQRRQQRLHSQTGSLKSFLPTRIHSLRHKYFHASSI